MKQKPTSEKKPTSIGAIRRANRQRTCQQDREIDQRHKAALKVLDQVEQRAIYDAAHGRRPVEISSDASPPPQPPRFLQPAPDSILLGAAISAALIGGAIVFSIWLVK